MKNHINLCLAIAICLLLKTIGLGQTKPDETLFYGILPANGDTARVSWLFGTMHNFGSEFVFKHKQLLSLARSRSAIVTEVDRATLLKGSAAESENDLRSDTPLYKILTRDDYAFVDAQCQQWLGRPAQHFDYIMPDVLLQYISSAQNREQRDTAQKDGMMDSYFQAVAILFDKPNFGLETAKEMLAMQRAIPLQDQATRLLMSLDQSKEAEKRLVTDPMEHCYIAQNKPCFCAVQDMEHYAMPGDNIMIRARNLAWMKRLPALLDRPGGVFVAVGAAHLCGEASLPNLLRKQGYIVVPMRYD